MGLAALLAGLLIGGFAVGSLYTALVSGADAPRARPRPPRTAHQPGFHPSLVASATGPSLSVHRRAGGPVWRRLTNPTRDGTRLVLLARARRGDWLRVLLPVRPNGSAGWVRAREVRLAENDFGIAVDLRARRLTLRRRGTVVLREPIGVGRAATPTPTGRYYVTELLRQPDPHGPYGPYAFGISAHSRVLTSFGGGRGEVGIHGTNAPSGIGRDVSHGCIRLRNAAIERLARVLPLGTPVRILR